MNSQLGLSGPLPVQRQSKAKWVFFGTIFMVFAMLVLWSCGKGVYRDYRLTVAANDRFHQQLNGADFEEIYGEATDDFRSVGSRADNIKFFQLVHDKMGNAGKMSMRGFHIGATPRGTFVNEVFETQFSVGEAQETFVWRIDSGATRLFSYHIDSPLLR